MSTNEWDWLDEILHGIDKDEVEDDAGWWPNSIGARFGAVRLRALKAAIKERFGGSAITGQTSDGFHTFDELYNQRMLYNAVLFRQWSIHDWGNPEFPRDVHKSWRHSDGELCFGGGWFIVSAQLVTGQITNHYPAEHWKLFRIPDRARAADWDGHTAAQAYQRLTEYHMGKRFQ